MATRYMTHQHERTLMHDPKTMPMKKKMAPAKKVGGVGNTPLPASKSAGSGFPTCYGSGGTFGAFQRKAFP